MESGNNIILLCEITANYFETIVKKYAFIAKSMKSCVYVFPHNLRFIG